MGSTGRGEFLESSGVAYRPAEISGPCAEVQHHAFDPLDSCLFAMASFFFMEIVSVWPGRWTKKGVASGVPPGSIGKTMNPRWGGCRLSLPPRG